MAQLAFRTERLLLRPRAMADLEDCLSMDRDPLVTRYIPGPWSDPVEHRAFVIGRMESGYPDGLGYWSIFERSEPQTFLGWVLLLPHDVAGDEIEIGWRLARKAWARGYATEAASTILKHAFKTVGPERVVADIDPRNRASLRVAEKLGMRYREDRSIDGQPAKSYQIQSSRN